MFHFAALIVAKLFWFCQTFLPSNIVIRRVRRRDGLKWGAPVGLAGAALYYGLFLLLSTGSQSWGWTWAHLVGIVVVLSLIKFTVLMPVSLVLLASHRSREGLLVAQVIRDLRSEAKTDGRVPPVITDEYRRVLRAWARQKH